MALVVDEWSTWYDVEPGTNPGFLYQQNTLRDALVAVLTLNIFNQHCDRVRLANLAQTVNVLQALILTDGPRMVTTSTLPCLRPVQGAPGWCILALCAPEQCKRVEWADHSPA